MTVPRKLRISAAGEAQKIEQFIRSMLRELSNEGLLIGLSGGLDSALAAYLAVRAVGAERCHLLNLTEKDSDPRHRVDAQLVADNLGLHLLHRDMTTILEEIGSYSLLPITRLPSRGLRIALVRIGRRLLGINQPLEILKTRLQPKGDSYISRANAYGMTKHRLRMLLLYQYAEIHNLLVVGAANRTEWLTGTYAKWGCDHCADLMPLKHLYRTQVEQLASFVGVPARIIEKPADPDILPGVDDKELLLGSFTETDQILIDVVAGADLERTRELHDSSAVTRVQALYNLSSPMRSVPYQLGMR